jgi:hypothetical protein
VKKLANTSLLIAILLAILVFLFFEKIFRAFGLTSGGYSYEILCALLGTIFTASIMAFMLHEQSKAEELKERNVEIFRLKITEYKEFIDFICKITEDKKISHIELRSLENWFYRLSMVARSETLDIIGEFIAQLKHFPVLAFREVTPQMKEKFGDFNEADFHPWHIVLRAIRDDVGVGNDPLPDLEYLEVISASHKHEAA